MDQKNSDLMHGFIFGLTGLLLFYSGDHIKGAVETNAYVVFMKMTAGFSFTGLFLCAISFIFGTESHYHDDERAYYKNEKSDCLKRIKTASRRDELEEMEMLIKAVIEESLHKKSQGFHNKSNICCMWSATVCVIIASMSFTIGILLK